MGIPAPWIASQCEYAQRPPGLIELPRLRQPERSQSAVSPAIVDARSCKANCSEASEDEFEDVHEIRALWFGKRGLQVRIFAVATLQDLTPKLCDPKL
jgi:hypothetical protein